MKQIQEINNMQKTKDQKKGKKGQKRLWLILFVIVAVALGVTMLFAAARNISPAPSIGSTFNVRRDNLTVTVQVGGSIRAHQSIQYKCQVERGRDMGEVSILSIVDPGTYVTQEDVDKGMVLVELDSSALEDRLVQERIELASDQENAIASKESYDIQIIENESSIARSELDVRFALLDLQKYLGAELAEELTQDVNEAVVNLAAYISPFVKKVENDPNILTGSQSWQEIKDLQDQIVLAEGELKQAEDTFAGTIKLHDANYVSDLELERDRLDVINRQYRAQNSKVNLDLFMRYDFPKNAEQYLSNYIEAKRNLQRTYAQCRAREAETKSRLNFAEQRLQEQADRVKNLAQQIKYCTIKAKAPGLVVYGTGGEDDIFRSMRGRGGSGMSSGIIAEGETVTEGQTLISMPDTAAMVAEISVHETEVDKVRPGQPASIIMDAFPDRRLTGKVLEVAPLPDQQRGWMNPDLKVYKTLVTIEGTHDFLRSRMSCKVEILVERLEDVIVVPITVVANRGGNKVCYVVNQDGNQERRIVQTGVFNDTFVQIIDGLEAGEKVLLNPPLITEATEREDLFEGVQPLVNEDGISGRNTQGLPGEQTQRGTRGGGRGRGMRGMEGLTEEQIRQMKEFGEKMRSGEGLTEEQMRQLKERFGNQGGMGARNGEGPTDEQRRQFTGRSGQGRRGRQNTEENQDP
ncbi:MAG: HlyD family efflux transporter periplasmic adaptor subunit [Sedimentisphaerales bacterium]|nr:HlyD family efflux transporter periplasmic adaptor subunit [Sedimentisphaerales bacterium]